MDCDLLDGEEWRPVVGWDGLYEVSDHGRVRSLHRNKNRRDPVTGQLVRGRLRKLGWDRGGYSTAVLSCAGILHTYRVHTLVLEAFVGPRPRGMDACHYDADRKNNRIENLRWDTRQANGLDQRRHRRSPNAQKVSCHRGHLLAAPNLVASDLRRRGIRRCKACSSANLHAWAQRKRGREVSGEEITERAHAAYAKLGMESTVSDPAA